MKVNLLLPALKASGGVMQALGLADQLAAEGAEVEVHAMWRLQPAQVGVGPAVAHLSPWSPRRSLAWAQLGWIAWRHRRIARRAPQHRDVWIFTHFVTFALAGAVDRQRRVFFVQDLEWLFVAPGVLRTLLRAFVLRAWRSGRVIAANDYLREALESLGFDRVPVFPIWADEVFDTPSDGPRDIDVVMVLRKGAHKRMDLYAEAIRRLQGLRVAVISPDDGAVDQLPIAPHVLLVRPSAQEMRELYARSRVFLMLSEHEGFGLPPLEAMGAGCVPICRDSGGVRAYMNRAPALAALLVPCEMPLDAVLQRLRALLADATTWQSASSEARTVFRRGATGCAEARRALARQWVGEMPQRGRHAD